MKNLKEFFPVIAAIMANLIWGSTFMASKVLLVQAPPITVITIRFIIALMSFLLVAILTKHDFQIGFIRKYLKEIVLLGLIGYTGLYFFQMKALTEITSSQSSAIMLLAPLFTLCLNIFETKKIKFLNIGVIPLSFSGALLIYFDSHNFDYSDTKIQGLIFTFIASFFLGWSVPITKRLLTLESRSQTISVFNLTFYSILFGTLFLGILSSWELYNTQQIINLNSNFWFWVSYLGIICSFVAFFLWNWSIKKVSPIFIAASMYLKTPVALIIGAIMLSEKLSPTFYAGTFTILFTLFFNQIISVRK